MNAQLIRTLSLAAGSLALLAVGAPASATSFNTIQETLYAGSSCRPADAANAAHAQYDKQGRIFNTSSTQVLRVECPLVRDVYQGRTAFVKMFVIDPKAVVGTSLVCTFQVTHPVTGQVMNKVFFATPDTPSSPTQAAIITSAAVPAGGVNVLSCLLPYAAPDGSKQPGIAGYEFIETVN